MIKVVPPNAVPDDEPALRLVKLARVGLRGEDRRSLIKLASAELLADLAHWRDKVARDEALVHMFAIGATERFGNNRNGDGFKSQTCRDYHSTFEKHARFYRGHKSRDPQISYGRIVKSAFNEPMQRIELLVALNAEPSAARRNGGLVADQELQKLASGEPLAVSMGCSVAYDVCSYCGNKARTSQDYCRGLQEGGHCKAGGLHRKMGAVVEVDGDLHQLHADNPSPRFYDISHVRRPADRIAYVTGLLTKAAEARGEERVKSAELARTLGLVLPLDLALSAAPTPDVGRLVKLAYTLADLETQAAGTQLDRLAFHPELQEPVTPWPGKPDKIAEAAYALASHRCCLPLPEFLHVFAGQPRDKAAEIAAVVRPALPGVYTRLLQSDLPARLASHGYGPGRSASPEICEWARKNAQAWSLDSQLVRRRGYQASLRSLQLNKTAAALIPDCPEAESLAEEYAVYKLAALLAMSNDSDDLPLTARFIVLQNCAD